MDDNLKRFLAYFAYALLLAYLLFKTDQYFQQLLLANAYNPLQDKFILFFPILFGLLLALPRFLSVIRESGSWRYDWVLFLAVGLPALGLQVFTYIRLLPTLQASPVTGNLFINHSSLLMISGLVLGYVLLASFKKVYSWY